VWRDEDIVLAVFCCKSLPLDYICETFRPIEYEIKYLNVKSYLQDQLSQTDPSGSQSYALSYPPDVVVHLSLVMS